jgi:hypothetical protein
MAQQTCQGPAANTIQPRSFQCNGAGAKQVAEKISSPEKESLQGLKPG